MRMTKEQCERLLRCVLTKTQAEALRDLVREVDSLNRGVAGKLKRDAIYDLIYMEGQNTEGVVYPQREMPNEFTNEAVELLILLASEAYQEQDQPAVVGP